MPTIQQTVQRQHFCYLIIITIKQHSIIQNILNLKQCCQQLCVQQPWIIYYLFQISFDQRSQTLLKTSPPWCTLCVEFQFNGFTCTKVLTFLWFEYCLVIWNKLCWATRSCNVFLTTIYIYSAIKIFKISSSELRMTVLVLCDTHNKNNASFIHVFTNIKWSHIVYPTYLKGEQTIYMVSW